MGELEGLPIYMCPGAHDKLTAACFVPAWAIPIAEKQEDATMELKIHAIRVTLPAHVVKPDKTKEKITTIINVPYLQVSTTMCGTASDILLQRTPCSVSEQPPQAPPDNWKGRGRGGRTRGRGRGSVTRVEAEAGDVVVDLTKMMGCNVWVARRAKQQADEERAPGPAALNKKKSANPQVSHLLG